MINLAKPWFVYYTTLIAPFISIKFSKLVFLWRELGNPYRRLNVQEGGENMNDDKQIVLGITRDIVVALIEKGYSISSKEPSTLRDYAEFHSLIKEVFTTLESLTSQ